MNTNAASNPHHVVSYPSERTMKIRLTSRAATILGLAVACVALVGCGEATTVANQPVPVAETGDASVTPAEVRNAFSLVALDYDPASSQSELAASATAIVEGRVEQMLEGRLTGARAEDDPWAKRYGVMQLRVTDSFKGPHQPGDSVLIELPVTADQLEGMGATGVAVTAYLMPAPTQAFGLTLNTEGSELASDAEILVPSHPQGLYFQARGPSGEAVPIEVTGEVHEFEEPQN